MARVARWLACSIGFALGEPAPCDLYTNNGANIGRAYKSFVVDNAEACCDRCYGKCSHFDLDLYHPSGKTMCHLIPGPIAWETTAGHSVGFKSSLSPRRRQSGDSQASLDEFSEVEHRTDTVLSEPSNTTRVVKVVKEDNSKDFVAAPAGGCPTCSAVCPKDDYSNACCTLCCFYPEGSRPKGCDPGAEDPSNTTSQASLDEFSEVEHRNLTLRDDPDIGDVTNLLAFGWNFVKDNQGTATVDRATSANAVPRNVGFTKLTGWKTYTAGSRVHPLSQVFKSRTGGEVGRIEYQIEWDAKGQYNGKGQFINDLHLKYFYINAAFGNKLNCDVTVGSPTNMGSSKDPLAKMRLTLSFKDNSVQRSVEYYVKGDGTLQQSSFDEVAV